jgi:hypothetical protein
LKKYGNEFVSEKISMKTTVQSDFFTLNSTEINYLLEWRPIEFPSVSVKKAINPFSPMPVLAIVIIPPAFSTLESASERSGFPFK